MFTSFAIMNTLGSLVPRRSSLEVGAEEQHLIHNVVRMRLISSQLLRNKRTMVISNEQGFIDYVLSTAFRIIYMCVRMHANRGTGMLAVCSIYHNNGVQ